MPLGGPRMTEDDFHRIGQPIADPPPAVFELVLNDHVPWLNPADFGLKNVESINPHDYFITSGDAVEKAKILDKDLWRLAGALRKELHRLAAEGQDNADFQRYETAVWHAAGQCRKLVNALKSAKGSNTFLETEWQNHQLLCIPKNPRK